LLQYLILAVISDEAGSGAMPIDRSCFRNARKINEFSQSSTLDSRAVALNIQTGQSKTMSVSKDGICFGYCCVWMKRMKLDKHYMGEGISKYVYTAGEKQNWMSVVFAKSGLGNALTLEGVGVVGSQIAFPTSNPLVIGQYLEDARDRGGNFMLIVFGAQGWAHAVAVKLDQSSTGGLLNWSYPCAFFDPNIGHGMYNNHADMAADIKNVLAAYAATYAYAHRISCSTID
jgi:hypothetical protein